MNKNTKIGLTLFITALVLIVLNIFIFPFLMLGMLIAGSFLYVIIALLMWIFWILIVIFFPVGLVLIIIGLISEPRSVLISHNQKLQYNSSVNPQDLTSISCAECGKKIPHDSNICSYCGYNLKKINKTKFCPYCGINLNGAPDFCFKCGRKLR